MGSVRVDACGASAAASSARCTRSTHPRTCCSVAVTRGGVMVVVESAWVTLTRAASAVQWSIMLAVRYVLHRCAVCQSCSPRVHSSAGPLLPLYVCPPLYVCCSLRDRCSLARVSRVLSVELPGVSGTGAQCPQLDQL